MNIKTNNQEIHTTAQTVLFIVNTEDESDSVIIFKISDQSDLTRLLSAITTDESFYYTGKDHALIANTTGNILNFTITDTYSNIGQKYSARLNDDQFAELQDCIGAMIQ